MTVTLCPLGELMASKCGTVDPSKHPDELFDLYSIPAFEHGEPEIVAGASIGSAKQVVQPGDILLSKIVPHIRRSWVVGPSRGRRLIASGEWIVFRSDRVSSRYLRHILVADPFHVQYMRTVSGVGGSLLRARPAHVARIEIPLPPLEHQRRIAEMLDSAEALREKRRRALKSLDELQSAIFAEIVGDTIHSERAWPHARLSDVLAKPLRNGVSPSNAGTVRARVLTLSAITGRQFDPSASKLGTFQTPPPPDQSVDSADLLICRGNGNLKLVGKGYFPPASLPDVTFPDTVIAARIDTARVEPAYLEHVWNGDSVRRQVEAVARTTNGTYKVNQTMLESIVFPAPPLALQSQFSAHVGRIRRLRQSQRRSLEVLDLFFASVQHRAFGGEL